MGIERLVLNSSGVEPRRPDALPQYLVANVGDAARPAALELAARLRRGEWGRS